MTKLAPEWVRTNDPVIRSPARYRWTTAPAYRSCDGRNGEYISVAGLVTLITHRPVIRKNPHHGERQHKAKQNIWKRKGEG